MENIINEIGEVIIKSMEESQEKAQYPYVVAYKRKSDDSLIGYHQSTFCQVTDNKFDGKRYNGDNPYRQLEVIHKNITSVLSTEESDTGFLAPAEYQIKKQHFDGLTIDDIYLDAEYLDENVPKQKFTFTLIEN
jgi:hypothetical protein